VALASRHSSVFAVNIHVDARRVMYSPAAGYVGTSLMAIMAQKCTDSQFTLMDSSKERVAKWNSEAPPIHEPGLVGILQEVRGRNLTIVHDDQLAEVMVDADVIYMAVGVETKQFGIGKGYAPDLSSWEANARRIAPYFTGDKLRVVVETSTVPIHAAAMLAEIIPCCGATCPVEVISNPAFISSGTAIQDLTEPDRVLLGSIHPTSSYGLEAAKIIASLWRTWVPEERIHETSAWSSELAKLVTNAMLAQRVSSINAVAAVCEATGAQVGEVSEIVGMDSRITSKFLQPSVGFGGQALTRIRVLIYMCTSVNLPEAAAYWQSVMDINEYSKKKFARTMISQMFNTVSHKKICILGFAFKKDTTDCRESAAIAVCRELLTERATLSIYDPMASSESIMSQLRQDALEIYRSRPKEMPDIDALVTIESDPYAACFEAHAIAILTEWEEFKTYDYKAMYSTMQRPAHIFDGRRILDCKAMSEIGFSMYQIGAGHNGQGESCV